MLPMSSRVTVASTGGNDRPGPPGRSLARAPKNVPSGSALGPGRGRSPPSRSPSPRASIASWHQRAKARWAWTPLRRARRQVAVGAGGQLGDLGLELGAAALVGGLQPPQLRDDLLRAGSGSARVSLTSDSSRSVARPHGSASQARRARRPAGGDRVDALVRAGLLADVLLARRAPRSVQPAQLRVDLGVRGVPEVRRARLQTRLDLVAGARAAGELAEHRVGGHRQPARARPGLTGSSRPGVLLVVIY